MTKLLQEKDGQWRERPNGATPVFDAGMSSLGTDDEAGGARAPEASQTETPGVTPMPPIPEVPKHDPRLRPWFWWTAVGLVVVALLVTAYLSFT